MVKNNSQFWAEAKKYFQEITKIPQSQKTRNDFYDGFLRLKAKKEKDMNVWKTFFEDYYRVALSERIIEQMEYLVGKKPSLHQFSEDKHKLQNLLVMVKDETSNYVDFRQYAENLAWIDDSIFEKIRLEKVYRHDLIKGIIIGTIISAIVSVVLHYLGLT